MYCLSGHPEHEYVRDDLSSYDKYILVPPKETPFVSSVSGNISINTINSSESNHKTHINTSDQGTLQKQNYDIVNNNMNEWKAHYYKRNFGFDSNDKKNYNFEKLKLCRTYLKSLMFTMQYYLNSSPPSWRWNYQHHVAPWPSDLVIATRNSDFELLDNFSVGQPYTSIEQLLLTVPMTSSAFPQEYRCDTIKQMLPDTQNILIDRINGDKYIYAEPILPEIDEFKLLEYARKIKLGPDNKKRNQVGTSLYVFQKNTSTF